MRKYITTDLKVLSHVVCLFAANLLLSSCGTAVYRENPALQAEADMELANVYFIRPTPDKYKVVADNPIRVDYQDKPLIKIAEGTYTLVKLQPGKGEITTRSKTRFTNQLYPIDVSRSRLYSFLAGRTYFIYLKRVDEEFRGITYDPEPVNLAKAKALSEKLHKWGLAKQEPIATIEEVPPIPKASPLEPVYPENVYPGAPYLLDKPVKK
ncbi:hypothetical protein [Kaarinaea lacus]